MRTLAQREKMLLGALVVVAVVVAFYGLRGDGTLFGAQAEQELEWGESLGQPPEVKMDLLASAAEGYDPQGRNLFSYYVPPKPVVKRPPPPPPPARTPTVRKPPPKSDPIKRPVQSGPPKPNFDYIGYIGPKEGKLAVFTEGDEVMVARIGERVQDDYEVKEFGYETVVLSYVSGKFKGQTTELKKRTR